MATIGIDLGTTYSEAAIAYASDGKIGRVEVIRDYISGSYLTPSLVKFLPVNPAKTEQENLRVCVGGSLGAGTEMGIIRCIKRSMGKDFKYTTPNGRVVGPEVISALILKYIKRYVEETLHQEITGAVITVPAYFGDRERKATEQAGRIAGLEVLQLINEPTAAALALGLDNAIEGKILVYDLGGGTFDVSVMDVHDRTFKVLGTDGDKGLGGEDFTKVIYESLKSDLTMKRGYAPNNVEENYNSGVWWDACEMAKRKLSRNKTATIRYGVDHSPDYEFSLTRENFDSKTSHLLYITEVCVNRLLKDKELTWSDIDGILTVGGATAMPMVREMLQRISSGKKLISGNDPDLDVAKGAAIYARHLKTGQSNYTLVDVVSQSLGVEAYEGENSDKLINAKIIHRNTPISEVVKSGLFKPREENQKYVKVVVKEGESDDPKSARTIGESEITLPHYEGKIRFRYVCSFDASQLIHIELEDEQGLKFGEFDIHREANLSEKEVQELAKWLLSVEFED